MGGGSIIDVSLIRNPSFLIKLQSLMYQLINWSVKINPIYYLLFSKCSKIIVRTKETLDIIPKRFHKKSVIFLETGIDYVNKSSKKKERKLKEIITIGRLIESKNIDQVTDVFHRLCEIRNDTLKLKIVGDGPLSKILKEKSNLYTNIFFFRKSTTQSNSCGFRKGRFIFIFAVSRKVEVIHFLKQRWLILR